MRVRGVGLWSKARSDVCVCVGGGGAGGPRVPVASSCEAVDGPGGRRQGAGGLGTNLTAPLLHLVLPEGPPPRALTQHTGNPRAQQPLSPTEAEGTQPQRLPSRLCPGVRHALPGPHEDLSWQR